MATRNIAAGHAQKRATRRLPEAAGSLARSLGKPLATIVFALRRANNELARYIYLYLYISNFL